MVQVSLIIMVSCTYAGLFEQTGLLKHIEGLVASLAARSGKYTAIVFTAFLTAAISCNQMLAVILTEQLCKKIEPDRQKMAISLEDTAIVIPPLLPWSIGRSGSGCDNRGSSDLRGDGAFSISSSHFRDYSAQFFTNKWKY